MTGHLPRRNPKHAKAQDLFQAFQTHCHPTRRRTHLQIRKAHLRPPPDRRGLGGDSPWCPGNPCTASECLLWVRPAQASISPRPRPRPGACAFGALPLPPLRASELHLRPEGALAPSCGQRLEQPLSGLPSLSGSARPGGLLGLGPRGGWGLQPPPRRALPPGLYLPLSKAFFVPMPT